MGLGWQAADVLIGLDNALELVAKEGAERFTHLHDQRVQVRQRRTVEVRNKGFGVTETRHLVLVVGNITIHIPLPVLVIQEYTTNLQFHTLVGYRTDILQHSGETGHLLYRHVKQQVACLLIIGIESYRQTVLEEASAQPDIVGGRCLPLQVWV